MSESVPSQPPGFRRFVLSLARGLERAGFDLDEDPDKLAAVVLEIEEMSQKGEAGFIQVNIEGRRGIVSVAHHRKRVGASTLKQRWGL